MGIFSQIPNLQEFFFYDHYQRRYGHFSEMLILGHSGYFLSTRINPHTRKLCFMMKLMHFDCNPTIFCILLCPFHKYPPKYINFSDSTLGPNLK